MCDTVVVTSEATRDGSVLFAKNSDREPGEAQVIELHPAAVHPPGAMLRCTYVEVPQAQRTKAVALSRPVWMWGAEMGTNEDGLVVGNEAVFTRAPLARRGLLGVQAAVGRRPTQRRLGAGHGLLPLIERLVAPRVSASSGLACAALFPDGVRTDARRVGASLLGARRRGDRLARPRGPTVRSTRVATLSSCASLLTRWSARVCQ